MKRFFVTTAIPYVNASPHVGHALEFVQADVIARYEKACGREVILLSGGDENALKNVQAAEDEGVEVDQFVEKYSLQFQELAERLDVKFDVFMRGALPKHHRSSQKLWNLCMEAGDIYRKKYTGLYCVGCETFYDEGELNNGECYEHPGKSLERVSEENYFFRLSGYQKEIEELIKADLIVVYPESRKNEVLSFVRGGLDDISISRSNERAKNWGVPVPGDETQRMYVWFDALNIYQSGVGFGWNDEKYENTWPADVHVIGKGIIRFHSVYWPAFLLSAKLALPRKIFVHGYFTVEGQKMSKTIGNVVNPVEIISKYGVDALRYYLLSQIPATSDGDFSESRLFDVYQADLANGLGNTVSRITKLCERVDFELKVEKKFVPIEEMKSYNFDRALTHLWDKIRLIEQDISNKRPWDMNDEGLCEYLTMVVPQLYEIAIQLSPFLPRTSEKIVKLLEKKPVRAGEILFPRLK